MPKRKEPTHFRVRYAPTASEDGDDQMFSVEGPGMGDDMTRARGAEIAQFIESALNAALAAFASKSAE